MKLEDQVVSLDLAKRLKELDVKQESAFYWCGSDTDPSLLDDWNSRGATPLYSAFTVAELGEILPVWTEAPDDIPTAEITKGTIVWLDITKWRDERNNTEWSVAYRDRQQRCGMERIGSTEADARAKMLVYLIENNLLKVDQINQP